MRFKARDGNIRSSPAPCVACAVCRLRRVSYVVRRASITLAWGFGRALTPDPDPDPLQKAGEADAAGRVASHPRRLRTTSPSGVRATGPFPFDWMDFRFGTTAQPALLMVSAVAATALWPNRACVVSPAVSFFLFPIRLLVLLFVMIDLNISCS